MFYRWNGRNLVINCTVSQDSDVSGIGVRGAFYTQAFILILLSFVCEKELRPTDIVLSNLSIQVTSAALIGAAYLDPTIDVPHTIITSQFAILFSMCRMTTYDLPKRFFRNSANGIKFTSQAWLLDLVFRTLLLTFNCCVWSMIRRVQNDPSVCPDGLGEWGFFTDSIDVLKPQSATIFAFVYCIMDIAWEASRIIAEVFRVQSTKTTETFNERMSAQLFVDPRYWAVQQVLSERWDAIIKPRLAYFSGFRKLLVLAFIITSVETAVRANGLAAENHWTYGQVFQMFSMVYLFTVLLSRYISSGIGGRHRDWLLTDPHWILVLGLVGFLFGMCFGGFFLIGRNDPGSYASWSILPWISLLFGWTPFALAWCLVMLVYFGLEAFRTHYRERLSAGIWRYPVLFVSILFEPIKLAFEYAMGWRPLRPFEIGLVVIEEGSQNVDQAQNNEENLTEQIAYLA